MNSLRLDKPALPAISDELIAWLEWVYPDKLPDPGFDMFLVYQQIGAREVIKRLRVERMKQARPAAPTTNE